jgi:hypothetical protein
MLGVDFLFLHFTYESLLSTLMQKQKGPTFGETFKFISGAGENF